MVVIRSSYVQKEDSFISLGILRHIKSRSGGSVRDYPWSLSVKDDNDKMSFKIDTQIVKDIIADIDDYINKLSATAVFKSDNNSHVIALIYQLLSLFIALKWNELRGYLKYYGVDISENELKRKLFLLERFKLIKKGVYSDSTYYKAVDDSFHKIRFPDPELVDSLRVKLDCNNYYIKNDRHRVGFLKNIEATKYD